MRSTYMVRNQPKLITAFAAGMSLLLAAPSWAATTSPGGIPFAGYITDTTGTALTGTVNARFYLAIGGTYVWCAQYTNIPVSSGSFFVVLGQTVSTETGLALSAPSCSTAGGTLAMSSSLVATASSSSSVVLQITAQPQTGGEYDVLGTGFKLGTSLFALNSDALGGSAASFYAKFDTSGNLLSQNGTAVMSSSGAPLGPMIQTSGVSSVATGAGLSGGPITTTGTLSLANTTVTAGAYSRADITVDAQGRLTAASTGSIPLDTGVSGVLLVANGGTGQTTLTSNDILTGNGVGGISSVTVVPIAKGGTNSTTTPTAGGVVYGTGTAMTTTAAGTAGYLLASAGAGAPTWTTSTPSLRIGSGSTLSKITHGTGTISNVTCNVSCAPGSSTDFQTVVIPTGDTNWSSANNNTRISANFVAGTIGSSATLGVPVIQKAEALVAANGDLKIRYFCGCSNSTININYNYTLMR